jgi:hypothetical protein
MIRPRLDRACHVIPRRTLCESQVAEVSALFAGNPARPGARTRPFPVNRFTLSAVSQSESKRAAPAGRPFLVRSEEAD